jgi:deazaflavin-dependent oxidoreductase (nitroreductase family)
VNRWTIANRLVDGHTLVYRATHGLVGWWVPPIGRMLLLDHVGARTGKHRTTPLLYIDDGDNLVIVASKGGAPRHPAWFHNLRANPDTTVRVGPGRRRVRAHVADADERSRLWPKVVEAYGGYADYQDRTDRQIPIVVLERSG